MCETIVGEPFRIVVPRRAWKVVKGDGRGLYYAPLGVSGEVRRWTGGGVMRAPLYQHEDQRVTEGGIHVFNERERAERYREEYHCPVDAHVIGVLVWGSAIPFGGGCAVEFAVYDRPRAPRGEWGGSR